VGRRGGNLAAGALLLILPAGGKRETAKRETANDVRDVDGQDASVLGFRTPAPDYSPRIRHTPALESATAGQG
jgi:hypothetical protein